MVNVSAAMFLLLGCNHLLAMEPHDHILEKQGSQVKKRLSLQSTGEFTPQSSILVKMFTFGFDIGMLLDVHEVHSYPCAHCNSLSCFKMM